MIRSIAKRTRRVFAAGSAAGLALMALGCASSGESAESAAAPAASVAPPAKTETVTVSFERDVQPLIQKHCFACHGNGQATDGVALDKYKTEADVKTAAAQWRKVKQEIDAKAMPPRQYQNQPTDADRKLISDWIQKTLAGG